MRLQEERIYMMKLFIFCLLTFLFACQNKDKAPLIQRGQTSDAEQKNTLFVFVGKKISVTEVSQNSNSMDAHFKATYLILQRVYGSFPKDNIEFEVADHYGIPGFSHYDHVMLFVSENNGKYYHEKYQYFDVYPTEDGKWAGVYHEIGGYDLPLPAKQIAFKKDVHLPLSLLNNQGEMVRPKYSAPYYKIVGNSAYPLYGFTIEELFAIKKNGVLKARGFFGEGNKNWRD